MLTVIKSPTLYNFSRNRMFVEIETDNASYVENRGTQALMYITGLQNAVLNKQLHLNWGTNSRTFTFKAATNINNTTTYDVAYPSGGQDPLEYISQLVNDLLTATVVAAALDIWADYTTIYFRVKTVGAPYTFGASWCDVAGINSYKTAGVTNNVTVVRPNYAIRLELQAYNGTGWDSLVTITKAPTENKVRCDLQGYADSYLNYDFPPFDGSALLTDPFKHSLAIRKFRTIISEIYGTVPDVQTTTLDPMTIVSGMDGDSFITNETYVLKAGFDKIGERLIPSEQFEYYKSRATNGGMLLTRQPRTKKISRTQREWLTYLFHSDLTGTACIKFRYIDADGNEVVVKDKYTSAITKYDMWSFPVNYPDGELENNESYVKVVVCVWDTDLDARISEDFTYTVDDSYTLEDTEIYFIGSDAGLDTLRCTGQVAEPVDIERETAERTQAIGDTLFTGDIRLVFAYRNGRFVVNTGFLTAAQMKYLQELLLAEYIFMYKKHYENEFPIVVPLMVETKQVVPHQTKRHLHTMTIELREAVISKISSARYWPII